MVTKLSLRICPSFVVSTPRAISLLNIRKRLPTFHLSHVAKTTCSAILNHLGEVLNYNRGSCYYDAKRKIQVVWSPRRCKGCLAIHIDIWPTAQMIHISGPSDGQYKVMDWKKYRNVEVSWTKWVTHSVHFLNTLRIIIGDLHFEVHLFESRCCPSC